MNVMEAKQVSVPCCYILQKAKRESRQRLVPVRMKASNDTCLKRLKSLFFIFFEHLKNISVYDIILI